MVNDKGAYRSVELGLVDTIKCVHQNNKTGKQCGSRPIRGTNVCYRHGGNASQVREKARLRVLLAADLAARKIIELLDDPDSKIQLAAARDLMDRAALAGPQVHAILTATGSDGTPQAPWQAMFSRLERRSRDRIQNPDDNSTPHLGDAEDNSDDEGRYAQWADVIDGEIVLAQEGDPDDQSPRCMGCGRQFPGELPPELDEYPERCADCRARPDRPAVPPLPIRQELAELHQRSSPHLGSVGPCSSTLPPVTGYVTAEEGVARAASANRQAGVLGPRRRVRRARPRNAPREYGGAP